MSEPSNKELSYRITGFAGKKKGRDATPAEKRCIEAAIVGIEPGIKKALAAELAGDIESLARCSAREMMVAHCFLKDLEEATGLPLLSGEVALAENISKRLDEVIRPYVNREIEDEKELVEILTEVLDDELFLMGMRHMYPVVWVAEDGELKVEINIKESE